jgi:phosphoribosylamine--glycine ligase
MKILVIGSGGREHALAWKAAQSPLVNQVIVAPGNAGTALEKNIENVAIGAEDIPALLDYAKNNQIDLTIVGPEAALVEGIVDVFTENGLKIFGPTKAAAQLEGSKAFTKDFLERHKIPTAFYGNFTEIEPAVAYIEEKGAPIVIKADGLAAGKGVILAQTNDEAVAAVKDMLAGNKFGDAGARVVIEEFLYGEEASFITAEMHDRIMQLVIEPTVKGMSDEGNDFSGFLYAGVMINNEGIPKVLEYNVRFGDPETQPIMMRLKSDLVQHCLDAIDGKLDTAETLWDERTSIGIVLAAGGYPESYDKGDIINGLENTETESTKVFHAGTIEKDGSIVTNGGRVLCAVALGNSVTEAQHLAYQVVDKISWNNVYYRTDIGHRAISE